MNRLDVSLFPARIDFANLVEGDVDRVGRIAFVDGLKFKQEETSKPNWSLYKTFHHEDILGRTVNKCQTHVRQWLS